MGNRRQDYLVIEENFENIYSLVKQGEVFIDIVSCREAEDIEEM